MFGSPLVETSGEPDGAKAIVERSFSGVASTLFSSCS